MVEILFASDRKIFSKDSRHFTIGASSADAGQRYAKYFSNLTVVGRSGGALLQQKGAVPLDGSSCEYVLVAPPLTLAGIRGRQEIRRQVRAAVEGADGVIARLPSELGLMAAEEAIRQSKPLAIDVGGCAWDTMWFDGRSMGKAYAPIFFLRTRKIIGSADFVSFVSKRYLQGRYPTKLSARQMDCSNVEISHCVPGSTRSTAHEPFIFGTIGSLHGKFKGFQDALAALASLKGKIPSFKYRILGQGDPEPWRRLASKLGVESFVEFDGIRETREGVFEWLDGLDVYVQPSRREGLPRSVIEAMSRGLPVIASDIAAIPEIVEPIALFPAGSWRALARLMSDSLSDDWRKSRSGKNLEMAQSFLSAHLQERRDRFWSEFGNYVETQHGSIK